MADPRLIVALDVPTVGEARGLVERLGDAVSFYKIGLQLFATDGMALARELKGAGHQVFLDWKLHDIGATVEKAAAALAAQGGDLLTVHAQPQVMAAAVKGAAGSGLKVLGVTVLTSLTDEDLRAIGYARDAPRRWSSGACARRSTPAARAWSPARGRRRWRGGSAGRTSWW